MGAILDVHHWLDMTTQVGIREFTLAHEAMVKGLQEAGSPIPQNRQASEDDRDVIYRALDSAVFNFIHTTRAAQPSTLPPFEAVRGAFHQGGEVAPLSGFHRNTHVQIALRENRCVLGWFLPPAAELLTEAQYVQARARLDATIEAHRKPRIKASSG